MPRTFFVNVLHDRVGPNKGDTLYASQAIRHLPSDTCWLTDPYNANLIQFLREDTDLRFGSHADVCGKASDAHIRGNRPWGLKMPLWASEGTYQLEEFRVNWSDQRHMAIRANKGDAPAPLKITSELGHPGDLYSYFDQPYIVISSETWKSHRKYPDFNKITWPSNYNLINIYSDARHTDLSICNNHELIPDDYRCTSRILSNASAVIGVASFTTALSANLGVPTLMLHQHQTSINKCGAWPWGGSDLLVSATPEEVSEEFENLIDSSGLLYM